MQEDVQYSSMLQTSPPQINYEHELACRVIDN